MAHQPGPWAWKRLDLYHRVLVSADGYEVEAADPYADNADDNARLIAASPTMYEYLATRAASGDNEAIQILEGIDAS